MTSLLCWKSFNGSPFHCSFKPIGPSLSYRYLLLFSLHLHHLPLQPDFFIVPQRLEATSCLGSLALVSSLCLKCYSLISTDCSCIWSLLECHLRWSLRELPYLRYYKGLVEKDKKERWEYFTYLDYCSSSQNTGIFVFSFHCCILGVKQRLADRKRSRDV